MADTKPYRVSFFSPISPITQKLRPPARLHPSILAASIDAGTTSNFTSQRIWWLPIAARSGLDPTARRRCCARLVEARVDGPTLADVAPRKLSPDLLKLHPDLEGDLLKVVPVQLMRFAHCRVHGEPRRRRWPRHQRLPCRLGRAARCLPFGQSSSNTAPANPGKEDGGASGGAGGRVGERQPSVPASPVAR